MSFQFHFKVCTNLNHSVATAALRVCVKNTEIKSSLTQDDRTCTVEPPTESQQGKLMNVKKGCFHRFNRILCKMKAC